MRPARAATRPGHLLPPCLSPHRPEDATRPLGALSLPPVSVPRLPLSPEHHQPELVATDIVRRGHRPSLTHPVYPRAPGRLPHPLHRALERRTHHNVASIVVSIAGHCGSSSSIRELPGIPNLALGLIGLDVRLRT